MEWINLTFIFMALVLVITAIMYMFAKLFKNQQLDRWVKAQLLDVVATTLIIIVIVHLLTYTFQLGTAYSVLIDNQYDANDLELNPHTSGNWYENAINDNQFHPQQYAITKIMELRQTEAEWLRQLYEINLGFEMATSIVFTTRIPKPGSIFMPIVGFFHWACNSLAMLIFFQYFIVEIIKFFDVIATLLLPAGILLRTFPISRSVGAVFISFSIGLALIFPISLIMVWGIAGGQGLEDVDALSDDSAINSINKMMLDDCDISIGDITIMNQYVAHLHKSGTYKKISDKATGFIQRVIIQTLLSPLIALTITYTFIRSMGMLLGADLSDISRGLIKLL